MNQGGDQQIAYGHPWVATATVFFKVRSDVQSCAEKGGPASIFVQVMPHADASP
jgi:hypothetical protein